MNRHLGIGGSVTLRRAQQITATGENPPANASAVVEGSMVGAASQYQRFEEKSDHCFQEQDSAELHYNNSVEKLSEFLLPGIYSQHYQNLPGFLFRRTE